MPLTSSAEKAAEGNHPAPSQLALLCLLLSPSSQQSGGSSVRTNKQGSAKAETANWVFWVARPPPPSLQLQPKLCSLSLCALPHFQGTQTQEQQIIFLSIHPLPKHPPADTACLSGTSQSSLVATSGSPLCPTREQRPRAPFLWLVEPTGRAQRGALHARALPWQRPPVYLPSRQTWPSQFG